MAHRKRTPVAERLKRHISVAGPPTDQPELGPCWEWTGALSTSGYGRIGVGGRDQSDYTHRVAYREWVGPIPDGLVIDHLCRNRICCNPAHLEAVEQRVNIVRGVGPALQAGKTHCPKGHAYSAENTRIYDGRRFCRQCDRDRPRRPKRRRQP